MMWHQVGWNEVVAPTYQIGKVAIPNLGADVSKARGANPKSTGNDEINTFWDVI